MIRCGLTAAVTVVIAATAVVGRADTANAYSLRGVRGVIQAEVAATISSELVARIVKLPFKPGQAFRKGDALVMFDCRRYDADLRAAVAEVDTNKIKVRTSQHLLRHRAAGANELALAQAKLAQAQAAADGLRVRTSQCVILAPFDGRVVERHVELFEMPQANAPLLKIVKTGVLELDLIVPSSWAVWLGPAHAFEFKVDETGTTHAAELTYLGAVVDPISRTMKVLAKLLAPAPALRPGMSGTAQITPPKGTASDDRSP